MRSVDCHGMHTPLAQHLHQRAEVSIAAIARSPSDGQRLMDSIRDLIDAVPEARLIHWDPQLLEGME